MLPSAPRATRSFPTRPLPAPVTLAAQDLAARRGDAGLWRGVAFALAAGEALLVRGPNGSGKTTLLRILAGLTRADAGSVRWRGDDVVPGSRAPRDDLLFVGHAPALRDELDAAENLASLAALAGLRASATQIAEALAHVGIVRAATLAARALSQGQRRRVQLALLTLGARALWILDEPSTALDDAGVAWLRGAVDAHLARGGIAVIATHLPLDIGGPRCREIAL
jgi:heme exporter protein A